MLPPDHKTTITYRSAYKYDERYGDLGVEVMVYIESILKVSRKKNVEEHVENGGMAERVAARLSNGKQLGLDFCAGTYQSAWVTATKEVVIVADRIGDAQ